MTMNEVLYNMTSSVTKNTYTTQAVISAVASTSVPRCLIPANYFSTVGKSLRIVAAGTIANTSAATFILAGGLDAAAGTIAGSGGATLFTSSSLTPTASVTANWDLTVDITCQAVGNLGTTIQVNGCARANNVATSGAWGTGTQAEMFGNNLTGLNNEISLWLELFGTWSASSASNTTTLNIFKVYGEN